MGKNKADEESSAWSIGGGDEGDRTLDLGIANAALSQLSYVPKRAKIIARRAGTRKPNPTLATRGSEHSSGLRQAAGARRTT